MNESPFSFKGNGSITQADQGPNWRLMQRRLLDKLDDPEYYNIQDEGLIAAVNTALTLGMPLLITGKPGVGKTQLGYRIAYELGCRTIFFPVKSGSEAQDLFYHIDHLRRLHAAQVNKLRDNAPHNSADDPADIRRHIRFQGLGLAILRAMSRTQLDALQLWEHAWPASEQQQLGYGVQQPSVVLIDEIDKAPMDFCNDILEEIRRLQFRLPELSDTPLSIYANPADPQPPEKRFRPQIVITSNSEKGLPEAFLRRCIYYQMQPPSEQALAAIVEQRLLQGDLRIDLAEKLRLDSIAFYHYVQTQGGLEKAPSTAELLNWLLSLHEARHQLKKQAHSDALWQSLARVCLLKNEADQAQFKRLYQQWSSAR